MLRQTALVLLLVAVVIQAESPWRRFRGEQWPAERGYPRRAAVFERDSMKRKTYNICKWDGDCEDGYHCQWIQGYLYECVVNDW